MYGNVLGKTLLWEGFMKMNRSKVQIDLTIGVFWGLCRIFKPSLFTGKIQIAKVVVTAIVVVVAAVAIVHM